MLQCCNHWLRASFPLIHGSRGLHCHSRIFGIVFCKCLCWMGRYIYQRRYHISFCPVYERLSSPCVIMCCSPNCSGCNTFNRGKECFILLIYFMIWSNLPKVSKQIACCYTRAESSGLSFHAQAYFVCVIRFCHLPEEKSAHTPL